MRQEQAEHSSGKKSVSQYCKKIPKSEAEELKNVLARKIDREDYNNITHISESSAKKTFCEMRSRHIEKFN